MVLWYYGSLVQWYYGTMVLCSAFTSRVGVENNNSETKQPLMITHFNNTVPTIPDMLRRIGIRPRGWRVQLSIVLLLRRSPSDWSGRDLH